MLLFADGDKLMRIVKTVFQVVRSGCG